MSLNWKEINLILEEVNLPQSRVEKVIQYDFLNFYFRLYKNKTTFWLQISLESGATRLHLCSNVPRQRAGKPLRFQEYLQSHIQGSLIRSAFQLASDRIIRIQLDQEYKSLLMWIKLWAGNQNIIISNTENYILEAAFRRPAQSIRKGEHLPLPRVSSPPNFTIRPHQGSFSQYIEKYYAEKQKKTRKTDTHRQEMEKFIARKMHFYQKSIASLQREIQIQDPQHYIQIGKTLLNIQSSIPIQAKQITASVEGREIRINLTPQKTGIQNAQDYFIKSKCIRSKQLALQSRLKAMIEEYHLFKNLPENQQYILSKKAFSSKNEKQKKLFTIGRRYILRGHVVIIGKNAKENDEILRHHVKGNDLWLHARDFPGSHVFIKKEKKGTPWPQELLNEAAMLAVYYSKGRAQHIAEVYTTEVKNLRRARHGILGTVIPLREKNISVRIDPRKISKLFQQQ